MRNWDDELIKLFDHPLFDDVKPKAQKPTSNDRLIVSFDEINDFYQQNNHLPSHSGDIKERALASRLDGILNDISKTQKCLPYDRFGILKVKELDVEAELNAIFENPIFNIDTDSNPLFDVPQHLKKDIDKNATDFVAQRNKCNDFDKYESGFKTIHKELKNGTRTLIKFQESHLKEGNCFLVGGVLVLLNKILNTKIDKNRKVDGRTHCVFENGTESNMLLRSLAKAIYLDGYTVQGAKANTDKYLKQQFNVQDNDIATGYIYALKSKSTNPAISQYKDLYKIGYTTESVEQRISNASQEETYLMDDVEIVATWKTYNLNVAYFENMLHKLFAQCQLQIKIYNTSGSIISPKEWFIVPLPIIQQAIRYIIDGIPIRYNNKERAIEECSRQTISQIDTSKLRILTLNVKEVYYNEIIKGHKTKEYRKVKSTTVNKYTYIDASDGKRWLKPYDAIRFYVGYNKDRESALIEVINIEFDRDDNMIIYSLGQIYEQQTNN